VRHSRDHLVNPIRSVCVFCGSAAGNRPGPARAAARLGTLLAGAGLRLVYGGGRAGLMGAVADAALEAGGHVTGVIPEFLVARERGHQGLGEMHVVDSMHARKQKMFELADGFAVLPGGIGTLDETFEIIAWKQLGLHDKPVVIVDEDGYWAKLDSLIGELVADGFAGPATRALYTMVGSVEDVVDVFAAMPGATIETDTTRL
jgi:uncharacterized protein (TIGR00730 family)